MKNFITLYLEINNSNFAFFVVSNENLDNIKIIYKLEIPLSGITDNRFSDFELSFKTIKENIYLIEKKFNFTFKEVVLILQNFDPLFVNLSGYKKLNGSQILRENITYILNSLKSCVDTVESKKTILHIFNSNFFLDSKKIDNLPIGLFGDFYSHELSFALVENNHLKNLENIFAKCNIKIRKILLKSFIKSAYLSENFKNLETFFHIKVNKNCSRISFFENKSLKYEQNFKFGTNIIIRDISKVTALKIETINKILEKTKFNSEFSEDIFIEKDFFDKDIFKKIKKKLIYEVALARIKEIFNIVIFKNINVKYFNKKAINIFLESESGTELESFKEIYKKVFLSNGYNSLNVINEISNEKLMKTTNKLVHFGWNKEAIPVSQIKKSLIARFFDALFN